MPREKIFLSAVSGQFKHCRDALASDLRAIGCEVCVQEDFQQGPRTLIERLEDYIAGCDRVIALVGDAYGAEAQAQGLLDGKPPRSYTQWEYHFALGERLCGNAVAAKDLSKLAEVAERAGAKENALAWAQKSLAIDERLARLDSLNATWQNDVKFSRAMVKRLSGA